MKSLSNKSLQSSLFGISSTGIRAFLNGGSWDKLSRDGYKIMPLATKISHPIIAYLLNLFLNPH